jgi:hypothetical protein
VSGAKVAPYRAFAIELTATTMSLTLSEALRRLITAMTLLSIDLILSSSGVPEWSKEIREPRYLTTPVLAKATLVGIHPQVWTRKDSSCWTKPDQSQMKARILEGSRVRPKIMAKADTMSAFL